MFIKVMLEVEWLCLQIDRIPEECSVKVFSSNRADPSPKTSRSVKYLILSMDRGTVRCQC